MMAKIVVGLPILTQPLLLYPGLGPAMLEQHRWSYFLDFIDNIFSLFFLMLLMSLSSGEIGIYKYVCTTELLKKKKIIHSFGFCLQLFVTF
jgi:hypothetical protein